MATTTTKDDGGAAFPRQLPHAAFPPAEVLRIIEQHRGMSLRDWFATHALAGFMANKDRPTNFHPEQDAEWCYRIADAMLKARQA